MSSHRNPSTFAQRCTPLCAMESAARVKRSLQKPVRKLTGCVLGQREKQLCSGHRATRGRSAGQRRRPGSRRQSGPSQDSAAARSYQADLQKERKLREAMNAQKNAERAAMRAHFRRKYQLSEDPHDSFHLRSVGGRVALPRALSKIIHPEAQTKDEDFNLLGAFQGLSFGPDLFSNKRPGSTDVCKVM